MKALLSFLPAGSALPIVATVVGAVVFSAGMKVQGWREAAAREELSSQLLALQTEKTNQASTALAAVTRLADSDREARESFRAWIGTASGTLSDYRRAIEDDPFGCAFSDSDLDGFRVFDSALAQAGPDGGNRPGGGGPGSAGPVPDPDR